MMGVSRGFRPALAAVGLGARMVTYGSEVEVMSHSSSRKASMRAIASRRKAASCSGRKRSRCDSSRAKSP